MVDDDVLLPDRREAIAAMLADALGKARIVGLELEVRPVERDELGQFVERQHALDDEDLVVRLDFEFLGDEVRRSSGIAASTSRRMTLPRRRCFSAVSNRRTRSSASSSTSMSLSRMTPEAALPLHRRSRGTAAR